MKRWILPISVMLVLMLPNVFVLLRCDEKADSSPVIIMTYQEEQLPDMVRVKLENGIKTMNLDDYVLRVLLGEIPASFDDEALKAQAVATRTYTLRKIQKQNKHTDADICANASCCQAYVDLGSFFLNGGSASDLEKIRSAVEVTANEVLTFDDDLIEATYYSCSGGVTEDAFAVWGTDVPYLKSVASPGEEGSKHYITKITCGMKDFLYKLGLPESILLTQDSFQISYTKGNGVANMKINGAEFTGIEIRNLLGLPSTYFDICVDNNNIIMEVRGYGHRVGMSQYGAEAMAVSGKKYDEILMHYYPGTELIRLEDYQLKAIFDKEGNL